MLHYCSLRWELGVIVYDCFCSLLFACPFFSWINFRPFGCLFVLLLIVYALVNRGLGNRFTVAMQSGRTPPNWSPQWERRNAPTAGLCRVVGLHHTRHLHLTFYSYCSVCSFCLCVRVFCACLSRCLQDELNFALSTANFTK